MKVSNSVNKKQWSALSVIQMTQTKGGNCCDQSDVIPPPPPPKNKGK